MGDLEPVATRTAGRSRGARAPSVLVQFARTRLALISVTLLSAASLVALTLSTRAERSRALSELDLRLSSASGKPAVVLTGTLHRGAAAVRFLARVPPVQGLIRASEGNGFDASGSSSESVWKDRLAAIFQAQLQTDPALCSLRYVKARGPLRTLVSRDAFPNRGHAPLDPELIARTLALSEGDVLVSDWELSPSDNPQSQARHRVQVLTPVLDNTGAPFGLLVAQLDLSETLRALHHSLPRGFSLYLVDARQDILVHLDAERSSRLFGSRMQALRGELTPLSGTDSAPLGMERYRQGDDVLRAATEEIPLGDGRVLTSLVTASEREVEPAVLDRTLKTLALLVSSSAGALALVFAYWLNQRSRLREQREQRRLAAIVNGSGEAIIGLDLDGKIQSWNPAAEHVFGYRADEALGRDLDALTGLRSAAPSTPWHAPGADDAGAPRESRRRHKDGREIDVALVASPIFDPGGTAFGTAVLIRDITREKADRARAVVFTESLERQVEERTQRLARASALQRTILAHASYAIIATNSKGVITLFNPAAEAMLGYRAEEVVGKVSPVVLHDPAEVAAHAQTLSETLGREIPPGFEALVAKARQGGVDENRWTYVRKNCSRLKVQLGVSALKDDTGQTVGFLCMAVDHTELLARENALREARAAAESSSRAKTQFLANMSHEIRTPMNAILGTLDLLRRSQLDPRQAQHVNMAETAARTLLNLLNDVLDLSKIEAGKLELTPRPFELEHLLSATARILAPSIGARRLRVLFDVAPDVPETLSGDLLRLQQIVLNLAGNAIKFTPKGHVFIRVGVAQKPTKQQVLLALEVADEGIGMSPEQMTRVFESFEQAETSTTRRFGGTGLGLAVSQRLARLMGGEITVQSTLGRGSVFRCVVPLPPVAREPNDVPKRSAPGHPDRLLLIDPQPAARATYANLARAIGKQLHPCSTVACAGEALDNAPHPFDLVLIGGQESPRAALGVAEEVQALGGPSAHLPIVVLTTVRGQQFLMSQGSEAIDAALVEPLTPSLFEAGLAAVGEHTGTRKAPSAAPQRRDRLHGLRVLLVEDNVLNQRIASELLREEGAKVTVAADGALGVSELMHSPDAYDVVLMDIQMPHLDGISATRAIRQELGREASSLPVIAMTANALPDDIDACLRAGMNDHVAKPFRLDDLVARILQHARGGAEGHAAPSPEPTHAAESPGPSGFEIERAIARFNGRSSLWAREAMAFCRAYRLFAGELSRTVGEGDLERARTELHGLKGLATTLGAAALARAAESLRLRIEQPPSTEANVAAHAELEARIAEAVERFSLAAHGLQGSLPQGSTDASGPLPRLDELSAMLETNDMGAIEIFEQLGPALVAVSPTTVANLEDALRRLDFSAAQSACNQLMRQLSHG